MSGNPTVLQAMTPFPIVVEPDTTWIAARALMQGHDIRHLPVVDEHGGVVGMVTLSDIELAKKLLGREDDPVRILCWREPLRIGTEATFNEAIRRMSEHGVDAAVVERHGRLAGVLTLSDIGDVLLGLLPSPFVDQGGPAA